MRGLLFVLVVTAVVALVAVAPAEAKKKCRVPAYGRCFTDAERMTAKCPAAQGEQGVPCTRCTRREYCDTSTRKCCNLFDH